VNGRSDPMTTGGHAWRPKGALREQEPGAEKKQAWSGSRRKREGHNVRRTARKKAIKGSIPKKKRAKRGEINPNKKGRTQGKSPTRARKRGTVEELEVDGKAG